MRRLALPLSFLVAVIGCKPDGASTDPNTATAAGDDSVPASTAASAGDAGANTRGPSWEQVGDAKLLVLDVGAEPRRLLRLQPAPGSTEVVELRMEMAMRQGIMGNESPLVRIPVTTMEVGLRVESVQDGKITCETISRGYVVADDGSFPPEALARMRKELAGIEGMRGHYVMTDRGVLEGVELDVPSTASPSMQRTMKNMADAIRQLSFPLPAEAVGPGARWAVTDELDSAGIHLEQTATYLLHGCDADKCTIDVELSQRIMDRDFSPPGMPSNVTAKVSEFNSSGDGHYEHDFRHVSPLASSVGVSLRSVFDLQADDVKVQMVMDMDMQTDFTLQR